MGLEPKDKDKKDYGITKESESSHNEGVQRRRRETFYPNERNHNVLAVKLRTWEPKCHLFGTLMSVPNPSL